MAAKKFNSEEYPEARLVTPSIDDYALEGRRFGKGALRQVFEQKYGDQGIGWDVVPRTPHTVPEMIAQNMGLVVLDVVVTPKGDLRAQYLSLAARL